MRWGKSEESESRVTDARDLKQGQNRSLDNVLVDKLLERDSNVEKSFKDKNNGYPFLVCYNTPGLQLCSSVSLYLILAEKSQ